MSAAPRQVTLDEFKNFFLAKAFDVVGNGSFRKHLARCKDVGDMWAVDMAASIQIMQSQIKEIVGAIQSMPQTPNKFHEICKDVMMSAQPPTKLHAGCVTCSITEKACIKCLDLSKTHKNNTNVFVDARFCYFFMLLWYCNKIEYIVRSFTRTWLDSKNEEQTYQELCKSLPVELESSISRMHQLFVIAKRHIITTLEKYVHDNKISLVLSVKKHDA